MPTGRSSRGRSWFSSRVGVSCGRMGRMGRKAYGARPLNGEGPASLPALRALRWSASDRLARPAARVVDVDLLAPDLLGDLTLLGHRVLVQAHALLRDGTLLGDDLLLVQHDLVLLLGDGRTVHGVADVGVRDRLALDANLLAADGDRLLDVVRDDVLAQARTPGFALGRADPELLLGARHRVVGLGARDVV